MAGPADKLFSGVVPDFIRLFDNNVEQAEPVVESPPNLARRDLKRTTEFPITSMAQGNTHPANMREVNGGAQRAVTEQEREAGMNTFYQDISVDRLRAYMASRQEYEYVLVDVRQPDEYAQGHIPGAVLIPLGEVSERISELPVDKDVVLYCRSGKRSRAAALFIASRPYVAGTLFNMTGGILAWNGQSQPAIPNLKVFELDGSNQEALYQAMDVERGADRFYTALRDRYQGVSWAQGLAALSAAEEGHARLFYQHWAAGETESPSFAEVYTGLAGDIFEGGHNCNSLLAIMEEQPLETCRSILETALMVQSSIYDLSRNIAHRFLYEPQEAVFNSIAEAEKEHMQLTALALSLCREG